MAADKSTNLKTLEAFVNSADKSLAALVGLQSLGVLASSLSQSEFSAFLESASILAAKQKSDHTDRILSQQELQEVLRSGNVKEAVREDESTARIIGKDGSSLGRIKTKLPFIASRGEQR